MHVDSRSRLMIVSLIVIGGEIDAHTQQNEMGYFNSSGRIQFRPNQSRHGRQSLDSWLVVYDSPARTERKMFGIAKKTYARLLRAERSRHKRLSRFFRAA